MREWTSGPSVLAGIAFSGLTVVLSPARAEDFKACSTGQQAEWRFIDQHQMGLAGRDGLGHYIGAVANRKKAAWANPGAFGGRNWFPADVTKKTLCGIVKKFTFYKTPVTGREGDLHPFVDPGAPFTYLFEDVRHLGSHTKEIWGEVTVPAGLRLNGPWFEIPNGTSLSSRDVPSSLPGYPACIYGPWVFEEFHDNQPEIHPTEQIWFQDPRTGDLNWILMQDSSNRFDERRVGDKAFYCMVAGPSERCKTDAALPTDFRAWAERPQRARLQLPFELREGDRKKWSITLKSGSAPAGGVPILRRFGGATLEIELPSAEADRFAVTLASECTTDGGSRLQGYVQVNTVLSAATDESAYQVLVIRTGRAKPRKVPVEAVPENEPRLAWLRTQDGYLAGGFDRREEGGGHRRVTLSTRTPDDAEQFPLPNFAAAFKDPDDPKRRPGRTKIESDVEVFYLENEREGSEAVAEALNGAVHGVPWLDGLTKHHLYVTTLGRKPFQITVSARANGTLDGQPLGGGELEVRSARNCDDLGASSPKAIDVCLDEQDGLVGAWRDEGEITDVVLWVQDRRFQGRVILKAVATDPFGAVAEAGRVFDFPRSGEGLDHEGIENGLVAHLAEVAGLTDEAELRSLWTLDQDAVASLEGDRLNEEEADSLLCGSRARRARLLNLYAKYASRDGGVAGRETDVLKTLATRLRETPPDGTGCPGR